MSRRARVWQAAREAKRAESFESPELPPCIGNDPTCPCKDGDACHYRDTPTTKAWPIPKPTRAH